MCSREQNHLFLGNWHKVSVIKLKVAATGEAAVALYFLHKKLLASQSSQTKCKKRCHVIWRSEADVWEHNRERQFCEVFILNHFDDRPCLRHLRMSKTTWCAISAIFQNSDKMLGWKHSY